MAQRLEMGDFDEIEKIIIDLQEEQRMLGGFIDGLKSKITSSSAKAISISVATTNILWFLLS